MSAYMVSKAHIDALVATAFAGPSDKPQSAHWYMRESFTREWDTLDALGELLTKENLSSIHYRYHNTFTDPGTTPRDGEDCYFLKPYSFPVPYHQARILALSAVVALKSIDCYEYQACEHPEWETSKAHAFCKTLRDNLICCLPGYDAAPWGIPAETAAE